MTVEDALARTIPCFPDYVLRRGDPAAAIGAAPHSLEVSFRIGGQEHFYLEGQVALAIPGEDGDMHVHSSTQHPTEVQHIVRPRSGYPGRMGHLRDPAHGRRLWRQGEPGDDVGRDGGACGAADRAGRARSGSIATTT